MANAKAALKVALEQSVKSERAAVAQRAPVMSASKFERADALLSQESSAPQKRPTTSSDPLGRMPLDDIKRRENDMRAVAIEDAKQFAVSIAREGLHNPITIDVKGRLLAGGHRRAALDLLRLISGDVARAKAELPGLDDEALYERVSTAWTRWSFDDGIPVVRKPFDAEVDRFGALAVEVTENEFRRELDRGTVKRVIEELKKLGYRDTVGRPKQGEKAIGPALQRLFRRSKRWVADALAEANRTEGDEKPVPPSSTSIAEKAFRERLQRAFGTKINLKHSAKQNSGTFTVHYSSLEELERVMGLVKA